MKARAPGSCANLGPGFDTLAVALSIYAEVEVEKAGSLSVRSVGEGAHLATDASHLAARVVTEVLGHDRVAISVKSEIPIARGLGSSSALAVAAAAAAGVDDPLEIAARFDGHPDNAAAAVSGGLITATVVNGKPVSTSLFLDPDLCFVVLVPELQLETKSARDVLPRMVSRSDAVFNLGRMGWLIAALADADNLAPQVMDDRLHQQQRTQLFPESPALMDAMRAGGAAATCWSGAGPSLLGLCVGEERAERVRVSAENALIAEGLTGMAMVLKPDMCGLHVE